MKFLSVCSGIEAASVAWEPLGFVPVAFAEVSPFPAAVLAHRFPSVPNLGDLNNFKDWTLSSEVDLIVGGTPCQSFSVAGLRRGLSDPRGNLALCFVGLVDKFRPKWFLWENVPGVLSSNGGRDFGSILGAMAELGYEFSYRVLDAQYIGVPQQRRRVFLVGHRGDWRGPAAVLFEPESVCRDLASRGSAREIAADITIGDAQGGGGPAAIFDIKRGLAPHGAPTLRHIAASLTMTDYKDPPIVAFSCKDYGGDAKTGVAPTLRAMNFDRSHANGGGQVAVQRGPRIRRLTPREAERLQGFPDDHTLIPWRSGLAPDGPRYAAIGNSMAVPAMRWIGERMALVDLLV